MMGSASDLTEASWQVFSRLLDEALERPVNERLTWLEALGAEHEPLKPSLRALLLRSNGVETARWLNTLPHAASVAPLASESDLQADGLIGPYRLLREIGVGGMGAVWLAERSDGSLKRKVALKLPRAMWSHGLAERMARERDILAALEHPNIARLYDAGTDAQGRPFLALEYVEGQSIDVYSRERGLAIKPRLQLLLQVAQAVAYAHSRLVVHRDLKPSNILVTAEGSVRLLDFGIAKLMEGDSARETQLTQLAGRALTPDYASPEQIRGEPIGTATDVYSLGVVAFELLVGERPYKLKRVTAAELEDTIASVDAALASATASDLTAKKELKGDLDAILNQALRKDPARRYASVDAFAQDLERHLRNEPVLARPDSRGYRLRKFVGRNRIAVGAAAAVALAVLAGTGVAVWQARVAVEQARIAREQGDAARKEAKRAQAVQAFLLDIFRRSSHLQADPLKAQATTARELLDIGAAQVDAALKDVPEAQLEVMSVLTDMYTQLSLGAEARALRRRGLEIARKAYAVNDVRLADAILSYSQTLHASAEREQIPELLKEARDILDRAGEKTSFLRGALLYETARFWRYESLVEARMSADELVPFIKAHHPSRGTLINGLRLAGWARMNAFEPGQAEPLFSQAVEVARRREGAAAAWLVGALADFSEAQWAQWKTADSERSVRESVAMSLKVNGATHAESLLSEVKLASLLMRTGRISEGEALAGSVLERLESKGARYSAATAANIRGILASAYVELGVPRKAAAATLADIEDLRAGFPRSAALAARLLTLAEIRIAQGRYDESDALLREGEATWLRFAGEPAPAGVLQTVARVRVELALARGDAVSALQYLRAVPQVQPQTAGADPTFVLAEIQRSEAARRAGNVGEALASAQRALAALRAVPQVRVPVAEGRALVALGRAQTALGQSDEAIATLDGAVRLQLAEGHPTSRFLADAQIALAHAIVGRNPARARELSSAARAVYAAAGEVAAQSR